MKHTEILDRILRHGAPALLLVLASSPAVRADVLKVPAQFDTIQEALDAAEPGDVVLIKSGTYHETVVVSESDITLRGHGARIDARYEGICVEILGEDVVVEGLTLANGVNGVWSDADRTTVTKCTILASAQQGMELLGDDVVVSRCTVMGAGEDAIYFRSDSTSSSSRFEKNVLLSSRGPPMDLEGGHFSITRNRVSGAGSAVYLTPTHDSEASLFARNDLELIDDYGLDVEINDAAGILIDRNVIRGTESQGISLDLDNTSGVVVRRNTVEDSASEGIDICGESSPGIVVEKNRIRSATGSGIFVNSDADAVILDNDVADTTDEGIRASFDGAAGAIEGNRVRHTGRAGIRVASGGATVRDNDVRFATRNGITVDGDFHVVTGNKVVKNLGDGIEIRAGDFNEVTDIVTSSNSHEGIDNTGVNTAIDDNVAKKNLGPDIAGTGNGTGSVTSFSGNVFGTGGAATEQVYATPD